MFNLEIAAQIYYFVLIISTLLSFSLIIYSWFHRDAKGARGYLLFMLTVFIWSASDLLSWLMRPFGAGFFYFYLMAAAMVAFPYAWLHFVLQITDQKGKISSLAFRLLLAIGALNLLGLVTNPLHHIFFQFNLNTCLMPPDPKLCALNFRLLFYVALGLSILIFFYSFYHLLSKFGEKHTIQPSRYLMPLLGMVTGLLIHLASFIFFRNHPFDLTSIALTITAVFSAYGIFPYFAYSNPSDAVRSIFNHFHSGVIAIDLDKKISWLNAEACKQFNLAHEKAVGKPFTEVFISYPEIYSLLDNDTPFKTTLDISPTQDEQIHYDCFLESIQNQRGEPIGKSLEIRDVTGRMELMRQINLLSTTDPTTGIFNRRHFLEIIQKEINRIQRKQQSAAFFLMDIDDFKIINDSFGHQTGDELLKAISATLKKQIRNYDILGRYAGDEFVLFMPEISKDDLSRTANRLLNKVRDTTIQYQKQDVSVTISIGVLYIEAAEKVNMVQIIQRADQALYNAKRTGKNDFAIWNQEIEDSNFFVPQS